MRPLVMLDGMSGTDCGNMRKKDWKEIGGKHSGDSCVFHGPGLRSTQAGLDKTHA